MVTLYLLDTTTLKMLHPAPNYFYDIQNLTTVPIPNSENRKQKTEKRLQTTENRKETTDYRKQNSDYSIQYTDHTSYNLQLHHFTTSENRTQKTELRK